MPKFNLYQSLHTTVIGPDGKTIEVQIRTREMHQRAEWGVAAHWAYKEEAPTQDIDWLNRIIDWQNEVSDPNQFMENLKTDLEQDEVFVFTPKGRVVTLPIGSTTVDFAYAVHTEVGHKCIGAKVNGRLVPLDQRLRSGDTCEIFMSKLETASPSRDWLKFVESPRARNKIKQWFSRERRDDALESGRDELTKEFRREALPVQGMWNSAVLLDEIEALGYADLDAALVAIGENHLSARSVVQKVAREIRTGDQDEQMSAAPVLQPRGFQRARSKVGVHVEGLDDVLVRLSRCCTPVPGDEIMGFVTRGRGRQRAPRRLRQRGVADDRPGVAADRRRVGRREPQDRVPGRRRGHRPRPLAAAARRRQLAVRAARQHRRLLHPHRQRPRRQDALRVRAGRPGHLEAVLRTIKTIDGVYDAYRLVPGKGRRPADRCARRQTHRESRGVARTLAGHVDARVPDQPRDARHPAAGVGALAAVRRCSPTSSRRPGTGR